MDFLKKATASSTDEQQPKEKPSSTPPAELLSNAKSKVTAAAGDALHAASEYGKLGKKGCEDVVEKAGSYIHKLPGQTDEQQHKEKPSSTPPAELLSNAKSTVTAAAGDALHTASEYGKVGKKGCEDVVEKAGSYIHKLPGQTDSAAAPAAPADSAEGAKSEGVLGDMMNKAKGLIK